MDATPNRAESYLLPLLTEKYYVGSNLVFAVFMRTPADAASWPHAVRWFLPAQILLGALIAFVLYPLYDLVKTWSL
jgi:hypothetical protein